MSQFLDQDGYINTTEFINLVRDIDKLAVTEGLKPAELYFSKKAIVRPDHPSKARLDDAAFTKKRAQPIKRKSRMPVSGSSVRMMVLLRNYKGLDQFDDYWKDYCLALKAIERHNARAEKVIERIKADAVKRRGVVNAAFDKNIDCFIDEVIGDNSSVDYVVGTSMMGKTLLIKLPNGGYMSIGKADKERFVKAKQAEDEPAAKPIKKVVKKPATAKKPAAVPTKGVVKKKPVAKTSKRT